MKGATCKPAENDGIIRFQSTLPVKGATSSIKFFYLKISISIHAPCEGSDVLLVWVHNLDYISIHAPCEGSDAKSRYISITNSNFNPRSLWRERLVRVLLLNVIYSFQSTLPVKGATAISVLAGQPLLFQSTLPVKGATSFVNSIVNRLLISIHAPCEGSDNNTFVLRIIPFISIHAPCEGSDTNTTIQWKWNYYFNPRSLWRERQQCCAKCFQQMNFNPRSLWRERLK